MHEPTDIIVDRLAITIAEQTLGRLLVNKTVDTAVDGETLGVVRRANAAEITGITVPLDLFIVGHGACVVDRRVLGEPEVRQQRARSRHTL